MIIKIQSTISGYSGKPCSLFSGYDMDTRILSVHAEKPFVRDRFSDCVVISNQLDIERDLTFSEEHFNEAIRCFFEMRQGVSIDGVSERLIFSDSVARARPEQSVEKGDMDANGQKYRINEAISCLQVAALATCWYANTKAEIIQKTVEFADVMNKSWQASTGCIITI